MNDNPAAAGAQQISPRMRWTGQGWKTNATAASQAVDWIAELVPVQGAANPQARLDFNYQINAGGYQATPTMSLLNNLVGFGIINPTAVAHLKAGTAAANTAPLKFTSGTLNTTAEAGAIEFLTDAYYGTITTGAARKTFAFLESPSLITPALGVATYTTLSGGNITDSGLTAGRVTFAGTGGLLSDDADLTFATDTLSATKLLAPTSVSTPLLISTGALTITPAAGSNLNVALSTTGDFAVNTNQFYVDTSTGFTGLGVMPSYKLHLYEASSTDLRITLQSSVANASEFTVYQNSADLITTYVGLQGTTDYLLVSEGLDNSLVMYNSGGPVQFAGAGGAAAMTILGTSGNIGLWTAIGFGTSAAKVLSLGAGTAPTTSPANVTQLWTADWNGAGTNALFMRTEEGVQHVFGSRVGIRTTGPQAGLQIGDVIDGNTPSVDGLSVRSSNASNRAVVLEQADASNITETLSVGHMRNTAATPVFVVYGGNGSTDAFANQRFSVHSGGNVKISTGSVIIGTDTFPTAATKVAIFDATQLAARIGLTGQEYYQAANTSTDGLALVLGVNRASNRQLWIGDTAALAQNATNTVMRFMVGGTGMPTVDAVATDGTTTKVFALGNASGIQYGKALVALGGGAAPTLGTIGGSGPTVAGQNAWVQLKDSAGADVWVPVWK